MLQQIIMIAQDAPPVNNGGSGGGGLMGMMLPMIIVMAIVMLLQSKQQKKQQKKHADLLNSLKSGDKVLTNSGFYATVSSVHDQHFMLKLNDKTEVKVARFAVTNVITDDDKK